MSYTIEVSLYKDDEESHVLESFHRGANDLEEAYDTYIEAVTACKSKSCCDKGTCKDVDSHGTGTSFG